MTKKYYNPKIPLTQCAYKAPEPRMPCPYNGGKPCDYTGPGGAMYCEGCSRSPL